jgi:hypothetical protein
MIAMAVACKRSADKRDKKGNQDVRKKFTTWEFLRD